jgi:hypothetical protein
MIVSCQNSLGVGIPEPPIINAFRGSAESSACAIGDMSAIGAQANSAMTSGRKTRRLCFTATPEALNL